MYRIASALLLALAWVTPAHALTVLFGGPGGFGVSASSAGAAESAGFSLISDVPIFPADTVPLSIPAPDVLGSHIPSSPSVSNPITATSQWNVTNGGDGDLDDAWLVFLKPLTYTPSTTGIDLQPGGQWRLVEVPVGKDTYFYPAVFLGDIAPDGVSSFLMHHVVGEALSQVGDTLVLPQYQVGVLTGVPLPEPALALLPLSVALLAGLRRRKV
ncbi:MAG TPA: hypothetical protein VMR86_03815 [Myxococcota bacterium]|nr:hypothetical protein [Myxococcota bacterium]